jgi:hypothetical protein
MNVSPIIFDLETAGLPNAADFLDAIPDAVPDDSPIEAAKNLTDPIKITADINRKALARHEANREAQERVERMRVERLEQAALDYNIGRIVALGWWTEEVGYDIRLCRNEADEAIVIRDFWQECRHRTLVGFAIKGFDARYLIQRSRYLGIPYPWLDLGKYSRKGVIDLFLDLTFCDGTYDKGPMRRTLHAFCKRFGIPVNDDIKGAEIPALVAAGQWEQVKAHCLSDVELTVQLAQRLGIIQEIPMPVEAVS